MLSGDYKLCLSLDRDHITLKLGAICSLEFSAEFGQYFDISLGGRIDIKLSSVECEKLELALLAINDIEVDESDIC